MLSLRQSKIRAGSARQGVILRSLPNHNSLIRWPWQWALLTTPIPLAAPPDISLNIIELGLLGVPLSLSGANLFGDQRTCHLINVTLYVCVGGLHLRGALILTRLRCAASNHYQNDESTQFGIRH